MTTRPESSAEDLDYARKLVATLTSRPLRSGERVRLMAARSILREVTPAGAKDRIKALRAEPRIREMQRALNAFEYVLTHGYKKAAFVSVFFAALLVLTPALAAPPVTHPSQISFVANGGVARTLASKVSDVVSVKDFGAAGDGVTDDTAAVNSAVALAGSITGVTFPCPGTYSTSNRGTLLCGPQNLQSAWLNVGGTGVSFAATWSNLGGAYAVAAYFKDVNGLVHVKGVVKCSTSGGGAGTTILALPLGYRPLEIHQVPAQNFTGSVSQYGMVTINTDGTLVASVFSQTTTTGNFSMDLLFDTRT